MIFKVKHNKKFIKNNIEVHTDLGIKSNLITVYSNDWASHYTVELKGRKPLLKLAYVEKCYR